MILSESEYKEFLELTADHISEEHIGGSAFNTCSTIASALNNVEVNFVTPPSSNKNALELPRNFTFAPADPNNANIIPRTSFICLDERGNKYVLKYLGNIYEYLNSQPAYLEIFKTRLQKPSKLQIYFSCPAASPKNFHWKFSRMFWKR